MADRNDMTRRTAAVIALVALASACGGTAPVAAPLFEDSPVVFPEVDPPDPAAVGDWSPVWAEVDGLRRFSWTDGDRLVISTGEGLRDFVAGVNLGSTIPGRFPGEQAIDREDFRRWFPQMRDLGIQAIRVYTIMPPHFYEELAAFNRANPTRPLLLVHGVWIPEAALRDTRDLFDPSVTDEFAREIERAVGVVHGQITLSDRPGHAWGDYTADVSPWLLAWIVGVEWDPEIIAASDGTNQGHAGHRGRFFESTRTATPTEIWLATMLDHLATLEAAQGMTMPLAFVNWVTTDPLVHPDEPMPTEDLVGIDPNHVRARDAWPGGYVASYHVYPYYPDFQRYERGIADFEHQDRTDPYAGYLTKLRDHHEDIPVLVTEFGVPSAMAYAHLGPWGRNQGGHSEQQQMAINAELLDVIADLELGGAFSFEWIDEWFKFTWNTIDYELPWPRRALWMNAWTNEAHFGIVAAEPGDQPIVVLDGDEQEWVDNGSQVISEGDGSVRQVRAVKDEGFLYLRIRLDQPETWRIEPVLIGLDLLSGEGGGLPGTDGLDPGADYVVVLGPNEADGRILVRASNDPYLIQYGLVRGYEPVEESDLVDGSGTWNVQRLVANRPLVIPTTGEHRPAEVLAPGRMVFGTTDPFSPHFESRATWMATGTVIELRLPYQSIGFSDPSSLQAYRIGSDGAISTESVERVGITVVHGDEVVDTGGYAWEPWQAVAWHERIKAGSDRLAGAFVDANRP